MRPSKRLERFAVRVCATGAQDRAEAQGRRRIASGSAIPSSDATTDRGGDAGGGQRAGHAQIPEQPRARGVPRRAGLLRAQVRREAGPRQRDRAGARRQGRSSTSTGVPRPRRLRARGRPLTRSPPAGHGWRGRSRAVALRAELGFAPDLGAIEDGIAKTGEADVPELPNNPTGAVVPDGFFERAVEFARAYEILIVHDNSYSEIIRRVPRALVPADAGRASASRCFRCRRATT